MSSTSTSSSIDLVSARALLAKYQPHQPTTPRRGNNNNNLHSSFSSPSTTTPRRPILVNNKQQLLPYQRNVVYRSFLRFQHNNNNNHNHQDTSCDNNDWKTIQFILQSFLHDHDGDTEEGTIIPTAANTSSLSSSSSPGQTTADQQNAPHSSPPPPTSTSTNILSVENLLSFTGWELGSTTTKRFLPLSLIDVDEVIESAFMSKYSTHLHNLPWALSCRYLTPESSSSIATSCFCSDKMMTIPEDDLFDEILNSSLVVGTSSSTTIANHHNNSIKMKSIFVVRMTNMSNHDEDYDLAGGISVILDLFVDEQTGTRKAVLSNLTSTATTTQNTTIVDFDSVILPLYHSTSCSLMKIEKSMSSIQRIQHQQQEAVAEDIPRRGPASRRANEMISSHYKTLATATTSSSSAFIQPEGINRALKSIPIDFVLSSSSSSSSSPSITSYGASCTTQEFVALLVKSINMSPKVKPEVLLSTSIFYSTGGVDVDFLQELFFSSKSSFSSSSSSSSSSCSSSSSASPLFFISYDDASCFGDRRLYGTSGNKNSSSSSSSKNQHQQSWVQLSRFEKRPEPTFYFDRETNPHRPKRWSGKVLPSSSLTMIINSLVIVCQRQSDLDWIRQCNHKYSKNIRRGETCQPLQEVSVVDDPIQDMMIMSSSASSSSESSSSPSVLESLSTLSLLCDAINRTITTTRQQHQHHQQQSIITPQHFISNLSHICGMNDFSSPSHTLNSLLSLIRLSSSSSSSSSIEMIAVLAESILLHAGDNILRNHNLRVRTGYKQQNHHQPPFSAVDGGSSDNNNINNNDLSPHEELQRRNLAIMMQNNDSTFAISNSQGLVALLWSALKKNSNNNNNDHSNNNYNFDSSILIYYYDDHNCEKKKSLSSAPYGSCALLVGMKVLDKKRKVQVAIRKSSENDDEEDDEKQVHDTDNTATTPVRGSNNNNNNNNKSPTSPSSMTKRNQQQRFHHNTHDKDNEGMIEYRTEIQTYKQRYFEFRDTNPRGSFARTWLMKIDDDDDDDVENDNINNNKTLFDLVKGVIVIEKNPDEEEEQQGQVEESNNDNQNEAKTERELSDTHHQLETNDENNNNSNTSNNNNNNNIELNEDGTITIRNDYRRKTFVPTFIPKRYQRIDIVNPASSSTICCCSSSSSSSSVFQQQLFFTLSICFSQLNIVVPPQQLMSFHLRIRCAKNDDNNMMMMIENLLEISQTFIEDEKNKLLEKQIVPMGRIKAYKLKAAAAESFLCKKINDINREGQTHLERQQQQQQFQTDGGFLPGLLQSLFETSSCSSSSFEENTNSNINGNHVPLSHPRKVCLMIFDRMELINQRQQQNTSNDENNNLGCCIIEGFDAEFGIVHVVDCTSLFPVLLENKNNNNYNSKTDDLQSLLLSHHKFGRRWMMSLDEMIRAGRAAYGGGDRKDLSFPVLVLERQ